MGREDTWTWCCSACSRPALGNGYAIITVLHQHSDGFLDLPEGSVYLARTGSRTEVSSRVAGSPSPAVNAGSTASLLAAGEHCAPSSVIGPKLTGAIEPILTGRPGGRARGWPGSRRD